MNPDISLHQKTISGIIWNFFEQLSRRGIQIATTLILAWFLVPADFGLMAIIAVFFAIATSLMDSGFSQALIRKKEVHQIDFSTAFYTNLVFGILVYSFLFIAAPWIAGFYNEFRLELLVRVVGLVVIINAFQMVQIANLSRKLNFKIQFWVTLPAAVLSGIVAILMAVLGFGIWSLVAQMLVSSLVATFLYWIFNNWRPTKEFSKKSFHDMFGFGSKLFLAGLLDTIFANIYVLVIGKFFSVTVVGYYYFADQIQQLAVTQLSGAVQQVTYPALSTLQDDNISLKAFYRRIVQVVTYIVFPCMIGLAVLAEPLFRVLLKEDWLPAVPYLQLLCIVGLLYPLHSINLNILKVKGRSDLFLYLDIIKKLIAGGILIISLYYGIFGIIIGQIASSVLCYFLNSYYSIKLIDYSISEQLSDVIPTLMIAAFMGLFIYLVGLTLSLHGWVYILIGFLSGFIFFVVTNYLLKMKAQSFFLQIVKEQYASYKGKET